MLKDAVKGRVPLIHVQLDDTIYGHDILKEICGHAFELWTYDGSEVKENTAYYCISRSGMGLNGKAGDFTREAYRELQKKNSTLVYANIKKVPPEYLDLGFMAPPVSLLKKLLSVAVDASIVDSVAAALGGLSIKDALNAVKVTKARTGKLDIVGLTATRRMMLQESKGLKLVDTYMAAYKPEKFLEVWCQKEKNFFLKGDHRLKPRGLLMDGAPGTGKSQGAKYIANAWNVPLYRLSATFMNKYVGESENNFDVALATALNSAPCVLLIDEIEKFFGNSQHDSSGTMQRAMGSLLWWLQEHDGRVLTVMTTNNRKAIPPELYREGRIDQVFEFQTLPGTAALEVAEVVFKSYVEGDFPQSLKDVILNAASAPDMSGVPKGYTTAVVKEKGISHGHVAKLVRDYVKEHHGT